MSERKDLELIAELVPAPDADLLVLAGDIGSYQTGSRLDEPDFGLRRFSPRHGPWRTVLYVPGNHEYDGLEHDEAHARLREACDRLGLTWLERETAVIDGVRFVGTTLLVVQESAEVGRQHQLDTTVFEVVVGDLISMLPIGMEVGHQRRLIQLNPLNAFAGQSIQGLCIDGEQPLQQTELVRSVFGFAQSEIGDGAHEHGLDPVTQAFGLPDLMKQRSGVELERRVGMELRHDVVVVRVEPFGHFASRNRVAFMHTVRAVPSGDAEVSVECAGLQLAYALRHIA